MDDTRCIPAPGSPSEPAILAAWPRHAQQATAVLMALAVGGLAVRAVVLGGAYQSAAERNASIRAYRVDLNTASPSELIQLPGVGEHLSARIDEFRRRHGHLNRYEDLAEVRGVGPATLERLRPFVRVGSLDRAATGAGEAITEWKVLKQLGPKPTIRPGKRIDLNSASHEDLQQLPGVGAGLAERIIVERARRQFTSVADLRRVPGLGAGRLARLQPHVTVGVPHEQAPAGSETETK